MMEKRRKHHLQPHRNYPEKPMSKQSPFTNNITNNRHLHTRGKDLTSYVKREIYLKDSKGNVKMAREIQVLCSWDKIGRFKTD